MKRLNANIIVSRLTFSPILFTRRTAATIAQQTALPPSSSSTSTIQSPMFKQPTPRELPINKEELQQMLTFSVSTVREILEDKGNQQLTYSSEEDTVQDAMRRMAQESVSVLVVVKPGEQGRPQMTGIFTESDYMDKVLLRGRVSTTTKLKEVMSTDPVHVTLDTTAIDCMEIITEKRFTSLPVCELGYHQDIEICHPVGLISITDLVKYVITEQKQTIEFLNAYIQRAGYE